MRKADVVVIGGGIVGVATAMTLVTNFRAKVALIEAEPALAAHQTGHNSGVIHSGLYYKPGSLKARNSARGRELLEGFCERHEIPFERCGKLVVASDTSELGRLADLERRGAENGLAGIRRLGPEAMREIEPDVAGVAGLFVPQTGIIDYTRVTNAYAAALKDAGGEVSLGCRFLGLARDGAGFVVKTTQGEFAARALINCAGLQSDRVARRCGVQPGLRILPFRGEYYSLTPTRAGLVKNLIYPVPDPRFPFLGVHYTRRITGEVEAGPNAVLAFKREGYDKTSFSLADTLNFLTYSGFWIMGLKYWRMGLGEQWRSISKRSFVAALHKLTPALSMADVAPGGAGVRAQALDARGNLVDDFRLVEAAGQIHVLNAPSPAATASLAIAETISQMAQKQFELKSRD